MIIRKKISVLCSLFILVQISGCGKESDEVQEIEFRDSITEFNDLSLSYSRLIQGVDLSKEINAGDDFFVNSISNKSGVNCPSITFGGARIELEDKNPNLSIYSTCLYDVEGEKINRSGGTKRRVYTRIATNTAYENSVDGLNLPPISMVGIVGQSVVVSIRDMVSTALLPESYSLSSTRLIGLGDIVTNAEDESISFTSNALGANRIIFEYENENGSIIKGAIDVTLRELNNNTPPEIESSYQIVYRNEMTTINLEQFISDDNPETVEIYDVKGFDIGQVEYKNKEVSLNYPNYGTYYLGVFVKDEDGILSSSILTIEVMDKLNVVDVHNFGIVSSFNQTVSVSNNLVTFF